MPKFPNAHLVLNSRDRTLTGSSGTYNNFILTNPGQNLVQGQMKDVAFSETYFPYDIPNIQAGYNTFTIVNVGTPTLRLQVDVTPGWYTGTELADKITTDISNGSTGLGLTNLQVPVCSYDEVSNRFTFASQPNSDRYSTWNYLSPYLNPGDIPSYQYANVGKDILSIMGFNRDGNFYSVNSVAPAPIVLNSPFVGDAAPLTFTDYIDICSPTLCQYQYLRDGSTTTDSSNVSLARRRDLICRLYIADEISQTFGQPAGTRPFVIHRQFKNQRVMKNTAANAINDVNIQLYDDCGQPLLTTYTPRNFQITFHVYEADDSEANANIGYKY